MRSTALNSWHVSHRATMTDFNGFHMPLYYKGITEEHLHTRAKAGLFDLGHMGRIFISGAGALDFVNTLTPARVSEAKAGEVQYSFLLREDGTVIDDITIYYETTQILLVINAGNRDRDAEWIRQQAVGNMDIAIDDCSESWGMIALQGPASERVITALFGASYQPPAYYHFDRLTDTIAPGDLILSSTGYTGECGFEIYLPNGHVPKLWEALLSADPGAEATPVGLGARDSLRLEAGMPLYGHELSDALTPLHAGLGKFLNLEKGAFLGGDALRAQKAAGIEKKLIGFEMNQRGPVARQGFSVVDEAGESVGEVTSGIFSPTLQKAIGMAYIDANLAKIGSDIRIDIRGRALPATIVKKPFYKRSA